MPCPLQDAAEPTPPPHPKKIPCIQKQTNKKKPQQPGKRGAIMIKSIPIPTRWATHKPENDYTTEIIPQKWKF